ncbi:MAG: crotonase/enoyl-CoA hydratase family protein [Chitinophagales bacterium]
MTNSQFITYDLQNQIATITMNDGGKNLMSPKMLAELNKALDRAEKDSAIVIITGHDTIFSAGFDLKVLKSGAKKAYDMLNTGFALTTRLLSFPTPVIIACNGHAIAMGVFLLLSGDYRIGVEGPFKMVANEVAIGLTMPATAIEVCKQRLNPAHFVRAVMQSEEYSPATAVEAGFLDATVATQELLVQKAMATAVSYTKLDMDAHYRTKLRARKHLIKALKKANRFDKFDIINQGLRQFLKSK